MTKDLRASQIQTTQIIASGSSGTSASIVMYDISGQDQANLNQGIIDPTLFDTSSIGNDIFLYVSGTKAENYTSVASPRISAFGSDVLVSGGMTIHQGLFLTSGATPDVNDLQLGTGGGSVGSSQNNVLGIPYNGAMVARSGDGLGWSEFLKYKSNPLDTTDKDYLILGSNTRVTGVIAVTPSSSMIMNAVTGAAVIGQKGMSVVGAFTDSVAYGVGSNVFFYVSGTINSWTTASLIGPKKHSVFAGDVRVSGSFIGGNNHLIVDPFPGGTIGSYAKYNVIAGGDGHTIATGWFDFGQSFTFIYLSTDRNFLGAGKSNFIGAGSDSGIVAGRNNAIETRYVSASSFIGSGESNNVSSSYSGIVAGQYNSLSGESTGSFIGGGANNIISGLASSIVAGNGNSIVLNSDRAFIGGGANNLITTFADTEYEAILAGSGNLIQGNASAHSTDYSVILGGRNNNIAQSKTLLFGYALTGSSSEGSTIQFGSRFKDIVDYRFVVSASRGSVFHGGLSGSLTKLADGTPYLLAGTNITLTTESNGAVTIDAASGGGSLWNDLVNEISVTSSVAVSSDGLAASTHGDDVYLFVSGTRHSGSVGDKVSVFGGSVRISGALLVGSASAYIDENNLTFGPVSIQNVGDDMLLSDASNPGGLSLSTLNSSGGGGGSLQDAYDSGSIIQLSSSGTTTTPIIISGSSAADGPLMEFVIPTNRTTNYGIKFTTNTSNVNPYWLQAFSYNSTEMMRLAGAGNFDSKLLLRSEGSFDVSFGWLNRTSTGMGLSSNDVVFQQESTGRFRFLKVASGINTLTIDTDLGIITADAETVLLGGTAVSSTLGVTDVIRARGGLVADPSAATTVTDHGTDIFFYVSGTFGSGSAADKVAVFGGDVRISGTLAVGTGSAYIQDDRITFTSASIRNVGGNLTFFDDSNLSGKTLTSLASGGGGGGGSLQTAYDSGSIIQLSGSGTSTTPIIISGNLNADGPMVEYVTNTNRSTNYGIRFTASSLVNVSTRWLQAYNYQGDEHMRLSATGKDSAQLLLRHVGGFSIDFGWLNRTSTGMGLSTNDWVFQQESTGRFRFLKVSSGINTLIIDPDAGVITADAETVLLGGTAVSSTLGVTDVIRARGGLVADPAAATTLTDHGADIFFYVSGAVGGKDSTGGNIAVVGGDLHISGNITVDGTGLGGGGGSSTTTGSLLSFGITDYASTTNVVGSPASIGQMYFDASQYDTQVTLTSILAGAAVATTASIKLFNLDDQIFVDIAGSGQTVLSSSGTTPVRVSSVNLKSAAGFNASSGSKYELQAYSSTGASAVTIGGAAFETSGTLVSNALWADLGNEISTTSSVAIASGNLAASSFGTDAYFYVSGTKPLAYTAVSGTPKNSVFDTDMMISGAVTIHQGLFLTSGATPDANDLQLGAGGGSAGSSQNNVLGIPYNGAMVSRTQEGNGWAEILKLSNNPITAEADTILLGSNVGISGVGIVTETNKILMSPTDGTIISPSPSFSLVGNITGNSAADIGSDVFYYVSGTVNTGSASDKVAVFGGSLYVSGNIYTEGLLQSRTPTRIVTALTTSLSEYDNGYIIEGSNASDMLFIVPADLPVGVSVVLNPDTTGGQMVVSGATGITLLAKASATTPLSTFEAYSPITVTMKTTGSAYVFGDLA